MNYFTPTTTQFVISDVAIDNGPGAGDCRFNIKSYVGGWVNHPVNLEWCITFERTSQVVVPNAQGGPISVYIIEFEIVTPKTERADWCKQWYFETEEERDANYEALIVNATNQIRLTEQDGIVSPGPKG